MSAHLMLGRVAIVLLFVVALPQPQGQILQVAPLARDGDVLVSFKLAQEPTDEIRSAIHSGLTVSLVYKIDLRRSSAGWIDRTIASTVVTATVRYDNLTRRYAVRRMIDGRIDRADEMDREDAVWAWLTNQFEKLPLFRSLGLEVNGEYYVRVRAHSTPRNMSFVWPWEADDVVGLAKFTFMR
ncbi:MAG: DUF4390 domain-containing protein [Acidobacteriota bacterium]|jgi:uncharacterized protein YwbE|nr:DUF4390 domain-containing protein [Acidobacteriota bacterium]